MISWSDRKRPAYGPIVFRNLVGVTGLNHDPTSPNVVLYQAELHPE